MFGMEALRFAGFMWLCCSLALFCPACMRLALLVLYVSGSCFTARVLSFHLGLFCIFLLLYDVNTSNHALRLCLQGGDRSKSLVAACRDILDVRKGDHTGQFGFKSYYVLFIHFVGTFWSVWLLYVCCYNILQIVTLLFFAFRSLCNLKVYSL